MIKSWDEMQFWDSGEWQVVEENLDELEASGVVYNPARENLFAALDAVPFDKARVAIIGQDPYPDHALATGIAFDIPESARTFPKSLANIFAEYCVDLHLPYPLSGNLQFWTEQGVLLWNSAPSCVAGRAGSHSGWPEWKILTEEIVRNLNEKGVVFVFLGTRAHSFAKLVDTTRNRVMCLAHPSPLAQIKAKHPFTGSRMFSTINDNLNQLKLTPITWRLP